jgi:hypothetical protein
VKGGRVRFTNESPKQNVNTTQAETRPSGRVPQGEGMIPRKAKVKRQKFSSDETVMLKIATPEKV